MARESLENMGFEAKLHFTVGRTREEACLCHFLVHNLGQFCSQRQWLMVSCFESMALFLTCVYPLVNIQKTMENHHF